MYSCSSDLSHLQVFDCLQYVSVEGEGLVMYVTSIIRGRTDALGVGWGSDCSKEHI